MAPSHLSCDMLFGMSPLSTKSRAEPSGPQFEERREKLLIAAASAIAARGYESVRWRDVAAECGVTTGMVQYYFESRDELLTAAFERAALNQVAAWKEAVHAEKDPGRRLHVLLDRMLVELPSSRETAAIWTELCASAARHDHLRPLVRHVFDEWHDLLRDAVAGGVAGGRLTSVLDVEVATSILIATIDGYEMAFAARAQRTEPDQAARHVLLLAEQLFPSPN